ncbi:alpha/beta fold hydrolase [Rhodococcoides fascians]|uniref:alpha/beta fold hydrolase n=1 Tax=Rhodococcoides fascians TaxID=1828 RepID=UPI00050BDD6D|nr:alpha/beta hydrolase [Rhodococcus fascians]
MSTQSNSYTSETQSAPGSTFSLGTVGSGGFTLDVATAGPASPIATIVSFPGSAGLEMSLAKDELAARHRVIELNPPGWGGRGDVMTDMHQSELGPILVEAVRESTTEPFYLIGTSMGGANALYVAAAMPERVRGIVLEGSMVPCAPEDLRTPPGGGGDEQEYPVPPTDPRKPWADEEYIRTQMANRMRTFGWLTPDFEAESALTVIREHGLRVLALLGDDDEILQASQENSIRRALPDVDFRLVPGGKHDLQNTAASEFARRVDNFITSS